MLKLIKNEQFNHLKHQKHFEHHFWSLKPNFSKIAQKPKSCSQAPKTSKLILNTSKIHNQSIHGHLKSFQTLFKFFYKFRTPLSFSNSRPKKSIFHKISESLPRSLKSMVESIFQRKGYSKMLKKIQSWLQIRKILCKRINFHV